MKISKYFNLEEFINSETAMKQGIKEQYNPSMEVKNNLIALANNLADPIREQFGSFSPTCGYRCERLNKLVGGVKNSEHTRGQAFDETFIRDGKNICNEVAWWLIHESGLKWSKLILEMPFDEESNKFHSNYRWLHIGYDQSNLTNQMYIAKKNILGQTVYTEYKK